VIIGILSSANNANLDFLLSVVFMILLLH